MTIQELHEIAEAQGTIGLMHARECLEDEATQVGRDALKELFDELDRLEQVAFEEEGKAAEAEWKSQQG